MKKYQVAVIGGGPGGYTAGIRLAQYGINTVLFEKERLGGVCLNWGCIPTKALVNSADVFHEVKQMEKSGILISDTAIDYQKVVNKKDEAVERLVSGIEFLYKKREIDFIHEEAISISRQNDCYLIKSQNEVVEADYIILATGSKPKQLSGLEFDGQKILSSRDILSLNKLPKSLTVVGGGVIGCEFASIFSQLGVKVNIVEFLPELLSMEDKEISKRLQTIFKKQKIKLYLKSKADKVEKTDDSVILSLSTGKQIETDKVLVSVGRQPVCNLKFENLELKKEKEYVTIDNQMRTNIEKIFAIGDVTGKMMLAHVASKQAVEVAELIKNELAAVPAKDININYPNIPRCTFTNPGIGSVGLTEAEATEKFDEIETGKFMFSANGKALASNATEGFVKAISDKKSRKLLGVHILGPQAAELIAQAGVMLGLEADLDNLKNIVYAHPTLSESVGEAIEDIEGMAIHKV